ncbi:PP2C family protein-serine/threonine phosphatase [Streptomyces sp. ZYX-F-203]
MIHIKAPPRGTLPLGVPALLGATAATYRLTCPIARQEGPGARVVTGGVLVAVGTGLVLHVGRTLLRDLRGARRAAEAAQRALLRPPPPRVGGLRVAAAQLSADHGARIGGDLYDVARTEHGVRVVMGDARGHGLAALATAAAVLGCFREAVHDERALGDVLRRLDRSLARHLRDGEGGAAAEEFVTVLLLEIHADGSVLALNCGHPWPHLIRDGTVEQVAREAPMPPMGPFPLPGDLTARACARLGPGEMLVLHTDGAEDARDRRGRTFPLPEALAEAGRAEPADPAEVLRRTLTSLAQHARGTSRDDIALLVLRRDRDREDDAPGGREAPTVGSRRGTDPDPAT